MRAAYDTPCANPRPKQLGCIPGPCGDEDWFARVTGTPYFDTWTLSTLHIGDREIMPLATYQIRACTPPDGIVCSDPLTIGTIEQAFISPGFRGTYGNVAGIVKGVAPCLRFTPPNGNPPNYILNVSDLGQVLKCIVGDAWTDDPGNMNPWECP